MKTIDVKNQPKLSVHRTFEIALNGIRYRLFRSIVTVVVIAVAIAFMMNVVCEAISMQAIAQTARVRTMFKRLATLWSSRLTIVGTPEAQLREVAGAPADSPLLREAEKMGTLPTGRIHSYQADAQQAVRYLDFFSALPYATRRALVRAATSTAIFDTLQGTEARTNFTASVEKFKVRLPESSEKFSAFLDTWSSSLKGDTDAILRGRAVAIAKLSPLLSGRLMQVALVNADQTFGQQIQDAGFLAFDTATRRVVASQARQSEDIRRIEDSIQHFEARQRLAAYLGGNVTPGDINIKMLWDILKSPNMAEWYLGKLKELHIPTNALTASRVAELARSQNEATSLDNAVRMTSESQGGLFGLGTRMAWLVMVSLLVCVVGISNAMLMTVTERFREIATLKCLGGLDGFIMLLFLLEACVLGFIGGIIGSLAGSIIGFGRMIATFGSGMVFSAFPLGSWGMGLLAAVIVGVILAAVAGVYPSYLAARLAPMEAMRIE